MLRNRLNTVPSARKIEFRGRFSAQTAHRLINFSTRGSLFGCCSRINQRFLKFAIVYFGVVVCFSALRAMELGASIADAFLCGEILGLDVWGGNNLIALIIHGRMSSR